MLKKGKNVMFYILLFLGCALIIIGGLFLLEAKVQNYYSQLDYYDLPLAENKTLSESEGIYCTFKNNLLEMTFITEVEIEDGYSQIIQTFECDSKRRAHIMLDKVHDDYSFKLVVANGSYENVSREQLLELIETYDFSLKVRVP